MKAPRLFRLKHSIDITERKKVANEILRQPGIAELAMNNMDEGIMMVEESWQVVAYNQLARNLFGDTPEDIAAHKDYDDLSRYINRDKLDQPEFIEQRLADARRTTPFTDERSLPDGRQIEQRHMPIPDGGFVRTVIDVTERIKSENEIKRQKEIAELAFNTMDEGIALVDGDGNEALYRKLLSQFADSNRSFGSCFEQAVTGDDSSAPLRLAHTLKGVAASIGVQEVSLAAGKLEVACRNDDSPAEQTLCLRQVLTALEPVISSLDAARVLLCVTSDSADNENVDVTETLAQLRTALEDFDTLSRDIADGPREAATWSNL